MAKDYGSKKKKRKAEFLDRSVNSRKAIAGREQLEIAKAMSSGDIYDLAKAMGIKLK